MSSRLISSLSATLCAALCFTLHGEVPPRNISEVVPDDWKPTDDRASQLVRDRKIFYATLFPSAGGAGLVMKQLDLAQAKAAAQQGDKDKATAKAAAETLKKIADMKALISKDKDATRVLSHLIVAMAWGGLEYTRAENDKAHLLHWDLPLVEAVAHGQRVVLEARGIDGWEPFYALLVNGDPKPITGVDPFPRTYASHGFSFNDNGQTLLELKIKFDVTKLVSKAVSKLNHGVDLSLGGLGNYRLDGKLIGPCGYSLDSKDFLTLDKDQQHGHLYLATDASKAGVAGILAGVEPSAPGTTSMYNLKHDITSGTKSSIKERSVCGGQKMQVFLGAEGPAQYGGMWVIIKDKASFQHLAEAVAKVDRMDDKVRRELFWDLLGATGPKAKEILNKSL